MTTREHTIGRLVGVGVGPGDPELLTLKALRELAGADNVAVPAGAHGGPGRAERIIAGHVDPARVTRLVFALGAASADRVAAWSEAADVVVAHLDAGDTTAFATLGDPHLYATFTYLADAVAQRRPTVEVATVPGITAAQALASRAGTVLAEGDQRLALVPLADDAATDARGWDGLDAALTAHDAVVIYKAGRHLPAVRDALARAGRLGDAMVGTTVGDPDEAIGPLADTPASYFSTVLVTRPRGGGLR